MSRIYGSIKQDGMKMALPMPHKLFTTDEYEQMIAAGILKEDDLAYGSRRGSQRNRYPGVIAAQPILTVQ